MFGIHRTNGNLFAGRGRRTTVLLVTARAGRGGSSNSKGARCCSRSPSIAHLTTAVTARSAGLSAGELDWRPRHHQLRPRRIQHSADNRPEPGVSGLMLTDSATTRITGPGANGSAPDGEYATYRVFEVDGGASAVLSGLTISHGQADNGAGIYNNGTLTVSNCTIDSNSASDSGGGIYNNNGTVTVSDSTTISDNTATRGAGIYNLDYTGGL